MQCHFQRPDRTVRNTAMSRKPSLGFVVLVTVLAAACRKDDDDSAEAPVATNESQVAAQPQNGKGDAETKSFVAQWKATEKSLRSRIAELSGTIEANAKDMQAYIERGRARRRLRELVSIDERAKIDQSALEDFETGNQLAGANGHVVALVEAARVHIREYRSAQAMGLLEKAQRADATNVDLRAEAARMKAFRTGSWSDAVQSIQPLVENDPGRESVGVWHALAFSYSQAGEHQKARAAYDRVLELCPECLQTWTNIAETIAQQGKPEEAKAIYDRLLAADGTNLFAANNLAVRLSDSKNRADHERAVALLRHVLELAPGFPAAWNNLGNAYKRLGDNDLALEAYSRAIELVPQYFDAYRNRGILLSKTGEHEKAIESFRAGLVFSPDNPDILYDLGLAYSRSRKLEDAVRTYRRTVEVNPKDARAWNNMGNDLLDLGKLDEAERALHSALGVNPRHALAINNLGALEKRRGNWKGAIQYYSQALELEPDKPLFLDNYVAACLYTDDIDSGLERLSVLVARVPESAPTRFSRAALYFRKGAFDSAIDDLNQVLQQNPAHIGGYQERGLCRMMKKEWSGAESDFAEVVTRDPKNNYGRLFLWVVHARQGHKERCSQVAEEAATASIDDPWAKNLGRYIADQLPRESLLAEAKNGEQRCEAYFYIGERIRLDESTEVAVPWYEKCADTNVRHFIEHQLALWEINR